MDDRSARHGPEGGGEKGGGDSRPQEGGEAATTRFGMEDGDNTDVPATGGVTSDEQTPESSA